MFEYGGNSEFKGRFDFFEWSAPYYENSKEVYMALNNLNLVGKKLKAIYSIGACRRIGGNFSDIYYTIQRAGIEPQDDWMINYEHLNDVLVPWEIVLCEPIQMVFDDDSTLEILPIKNGGARIGVNSIPTGLVDGLNKCEVDSNKFFKELIGKELRCVDLDICKKQTKRINKYTIESEKAYNETRTEYAINFDFEYPYKMKITQNWESWYMVQAQKGGYRQSEIAYKRVEEASINTQQVKIVAGRDGGGVFWIIGINSEEERRSDVPNLDCFGMAIDEVDIDDYLIEFLCKYFEPSIQKRNEYEGRSFDGYGGNLYTFGAMRKMLDDIYKVMNMLKEDYDNPKLAKIKSHWSVYKYTDKTRAELSAEELNELRKNLIPEALDFYERFCSRMENMLKIPGNDTMSFAGP